MGSFTCKKGCIRSQNSCASIALRLVLIMLTWQGPIPWVHCHGAEVDSSVSGEMLGWFSHHLQSHHDCAACGGSLDLGWHTHFDIPQPPWQESGDDAHVPDDCLPASHVQSLDLQLSSSAMPATMSTAADDLHAVNRLIVLAQRRGELRFYATFAPELPLPARFCIARC